MTVRQLLESTDSRELAEWQAYAAIEPFGDIRADIRAGIIAAVVVNSNPYRKRGSRAAKPSDFIPNFEQGPAQEFDWTRLRDTFKGLAEQAKKREAVKSRRGSRARGRKPG